ncbi:hypothetical protein SPRG_15751 [Saprolegnia parasitica CBS 223.65]|uniref:Uncharacterized protein n=1 Tax=Saprolegnia parasitica (strain CBS 223.65) TaxID=695850 RepID=A0A067BWK9_SAPPC|nr:hypothetical protein SPRG_15751 [Saprolegnia parasitica CBS 223.65]KDO19002.1 hypothetical protein SPRG_15751 [Saprolegnia parasitica CBS 223.65]|eukprot:XP_012210289.1 hypothetical protein SPRG_15751 [Saprolegnia parasitica CBS 223.65]
MGWQPGGKGKQHGRVQQHGRRAQDGHGPQQCSEHVLHDQAARRPPMARKVRVWLCNDPEPQLVRRHGRQRPALGQLTTVAVVPRRFVTRRQGQARDQLSALGAQGTAPPDADADRAARRGHDRHVGPAKPVLEAQNQKKHVDISPAYTAQPNGPMLAPTPSNGAPRKLPLAPAPSMDDDDDDSGDDDGENPTGATHNGAALRGGRWTSEEHERFLQGFRLHGHKWKRVQMVVRSRTVTQVRTHAQKYLLKLQKMTGGPEQQRSSTATTGADADGRFLAPSQFGSGATSPTQSMTSGNDDDAAHDKVATTGNELGQPLSPRSAVTLQTVQPRKLKTMKKQQQQQKRTTKRSDLDGSSLVHIEEAAYTLCALMKEHIDDLEAIVTDHEDDGMEVDDDDGTESTEDESMDSSSSPVSSADMKKRYLCRKCRVPKKGHVCPSSSSEDSAAKSLSLKKMSLHESDLDCYEPLEAEWTDLDKYVGYRVARCFGPNLWCRGTIDQVVATGSDQDKIHIVYSEASGRHEWLLKSDAIECIAIEGLNTDDDEAYGVFAGSSLKKRKHWSSLASSLRESPEKDDDFEDDDDDAKAAHPAKRLCSP